MTTVPRLSLSGTPHERGVEHGEQFAAEIRSNVDIYLDRFAYHGADEESVCEQAGEFASLIDDENARYAEEMAGVAEGSGVPIEEVAMLNARYEVMYGAFSDETEELAEAEPDGCTSFGAQPEVTADGHSYIGQNWDWIADVAPNTFVMEIERDDRPSMVALTEAGIVGGKMGVNEHGIGLIVNGLVTENDGENPFRKPFHVRCREILNAERLDTATEPVIASDRACSANFLIGHPEGEMINVEAAPETANYLYPEDGLLTHANHFEDRTDVDSQFERLVPHTPCRAPRMKRLLTGQRGEIDQKSLREVLTDHFNRPASICRHIEADKPEQERVQSNASVILNLTERTMRVTNRPPCEMEYETFTAAS